MFSAQDVKALREKTGAGMMDCKKALQESNGNMDDAITWLREKGISKAAKKESRIAAEGLAKSLIKGNKAVILEVNSETDFVAKNENFQNFVNELAEIIIDSNAKTMDEALNLEKDGEKTSGKNLEYFDQTTGEKYVPYVIEPSLGVERLFLALLTEAYDEEVLDEEKNDKRIVMHFHPAIAPFKAAVLPLSKKLDDGASEVFDMLSAKFNIEYDNAGSIGKRYRRQDEIGTPFCITYDFDSVEDGCVTVRFRDSMEQKRIKIDELEAFDYATYKKNGFKVDKLGDYPLELETKPENL